MKKNKQALMFFMVALTGSVAALPTNAFTSFIGGSDLTISPEQAFLDFETAVGGTLSAPEDFESFTGVSNPNDGNILKVVNTTIAGVGTIIGADQGFGGVLNAPFNSAGNVTQPSPPATNYYLGGVNPGGEQNFTIVTQEPVGGIGFFANDIGDFNATLIAKITTGDGIVLGQVIPLAPDGQTPSDGNLAFLSILGDDPTETITEVELDIFLDDGQNVNGDSFGIDDIYLIPAGNVIPPPTGTPEPSALIGLGLLGAFGFVSRRQRK